MPRDAVVAEQTLDLAASDNACSLRLCGASIALDADSAVPADIEIEHGRIRNILRRSKGGQSAAPRDREVFEIDLSGCLLLPGLINAHDHLEFSLFPKLGRGPYPNAEAWAKDIYHPETSPQREHLLVPKPIRLWWGGIKNLLCGVTTVCHHNEFREDVFGYGFPIRVLERYAWSHSLQFGGDVTADFEAGDSQAPYIIHLGEGTDAASAAEIFELDRRGLLNARTVIVHGVALDDVGHNLLIRHRAALIWCPGSNLFTLGATLSPERIEGNGRTALGSDSSLTAGDLLDQIAIAHKMGVPAKQIFGLVTTRSADVLRLQHGEGSLRTGSVADIVAIRDHDLSPADTLVQTTTDLIELVLSAGRPHLLSSSMLSRFPVGHRTGLDAITVGGCERYVRAPVAHLLQETRKRLGNDVALAGKYVQE